MVNFNDLNSVKNPIKTKGEIDSKSLDYQTNLDDDENIEEEESENNDNNHR